MGKLDSKVAIVTGASRGIGKATALLFAAEGARVVCAARTLGEGEHILEGSLTITWPKSGQLEAPRLLSRLTCPTKTVARIWWRPPGTDLARLMCW